MPPPDHCSDVLFTRRPISQCRGKGADSALARKNKGGFNRAISDRRGQCGAIFLANAGMVQRARHPPRAKATARQSPRARLPK